MSFNRVLDFRSLVAWCGNAVRNISTIFSGSSFMAHLSSRGPAISMCIPCDPLFRPPERQEMRGDGTRFPTNLPVSYKIRSLLGSSSKVACIMNVHESPEDI
jgi:hypothetical protein